MPLYFGNKWRIKATTVTGILLCLERVVKKKQNRIVIIIYLVFR